MNHARRVAVREQIVAKPDYTDAFELRVSQPDDRSAEQWLRAGLEGSPTPVRRLILVVHRHVLRLRLGPVTAGDHVLGWRIASRAADVVRLEASGSLADAVIVGRRLDATGVQLTTALSYRRPALARGVWAVIGPLHRRIAPLLLERAATISERRAARSSV
jgi:hypothetical protein